jgi:hypothetical protein
MVGMKRKSTDQKEVSNANQSTKKRKISTEQQSKK